MQLAQDRFDFAHPQAKPLNQHCTANETGCRYANEHIPAPSQDVLSAVVPVAGPTETVVLAGGCFWGIQAVFQHTQGVLSAVSGYAGGKSSEADYDKVSTGGTGHAEAVPTSQVLSCDRLSNDCGLTSAARTVSETASSAHTSLRNCKRANFNRYLAQGQRPHVNFYGVRYTNDVLASTTTFLGQELRLYYNSQDLRSVRAFAADGGEIGVLKAQGAWGEIAHDLKLRQEIVRLRGCKRLASNLNQEYLAQFIEEKMAKAKRTRRGASDLTKTLRTLTSAPVAALSDPPKQQITKVTVDTVASPPVLERVEPQRLSIGTGYAGPS